MPHPGNITAPITLLSYGRSGTSLVHNIIGAHPQVEHCGETQPLLFGSWEGAARCEGVVRPDNTLPAGATHKDRCGRTVRAAFQSMFPDRRERPFWVHKPINVPFTVPEWKRDKAHHMAEICPWYWEVMENSFPDGRFLTVLRHPYDVVLSALKYWKFNRSHIWRSIVCMAEFIAHEQSPVKHAVSHRRLVIDPEPEIDSLLDHLRLSRDTACYAAAKTVYVPHTGRKGGDLASAQAQTAAAFSHRAEWDTLDKEGFTKRDYKILVEMWAKFGETLEF
ncbi:MAG: sulfotransferase [Pseudomonadota bacterium]